MSDAIFAPFSVINKVMKCDFSIQQEELREIVTHAINKLVNTYFGNSEALERLNRICTQ
ncbi:4868_t:CDS:1, partial [Cetraspora pellucida]